MKMYQRHRIYPTPELVDFMARQNGCNRFIWNHFVALEQELGHYLTYYDMADQLTNVLKYKYTWLCEVNAQSLQQTLMDFDKAVKAHHRRPRLFDKPKFKKKQWRVSFRVPQRANVNREKGLLYLPKLKKPVKIIIERELPKFTMCTVVKEEDDRWYATFIVDKQIIDQTPRPEVRHLGIDLGLTDLIITSEGERIAPPQFFRKAEKNIARKNKAIKNKKEGSRRWLEGRKKLAKAHSKVKHQRADFIHKVTTKLANDNEAIAVESLDIKDMSKEHRFAKAIMDASWGMFTDYLESKLAIQGRVFTSCMGKFPSTQLCSCCGGLFGPRGLEGLKTRLWTCGFCGTDHDRDINAAKNIAKQGDQIYLEDLRKRIAVG